MQRSTDQNWWFRDRVVRISDRTGPIPKLSQRSENLKSWTNRNNEASLSSPVCVVVHRSIPIVIAL